MIEAGKYYQHKESGKALRVVSSAKGDYYNVCYSDIDKDNSVLHKDYIKEYNSDDFKKINLGDGNIFSEFINMFQIYIYISIEMFYEFRGFKYIDEESFITEIGNEHKKFRVHYTEYNEDFFVWDKETFTGNEDFMWIIGKNHKFVFNKHAMYERITNGYTISKHDGKHYFSLNNSLVEVFVNKSGDKFACRMKHLEDICSVSITEHCVFK